jgi:hypothetical protein
MSFARILVSTSQFYSLLKRAQAASRLSRNEGVAMRFRTHAIVLSFLCLSASCAKQAAPRNAAGKPRAPRRRPAASSSSSSPSNAAAEPATTAEAAPLVDPDFPDFPLEELRARSSTLTCWP